MRTFDKRYFRLLMADKEITLRGLAARMGMGHSQLSLTMSGTRRLQLTEAAQLADLLGVTLQDVAEHAGAYDVPPPQVAKSGHTRHFEELNWLQNRNSDATVTSLQHENKPHQGEEMSKNQQSSTTLELMPAEVPQSGQNTALAQASRTEANLMPAPTNPAQVVAYAMAHGAPISEIREFMALQREWEADQARKAYVEAMAQFKLDPPTIVKDKQVSFDTGKGKTEYKHATIGNVTDKIVQGLAKYGFSHAWDTQQRDGQVIVTCTITHRLGHKESVTLQAAPDQSGGKNGIQSIISAQTYLQRHTLLAATGLATQDQGDDDGKNFGLDTSLADRWIKEIQSCKNEAEMKGVWAAASKDIREAKDTFARNEVAVAYTEHLQLLKGAAQ